MSRRTPQTALQNVRTPNLLGAPFGRSLNTSKSGPEANSKVAQRRQGRRHGWTHGWRRGLQPTTGWTHVAVPVSLQNSGELVKHETKHFPTPIDIKQAVCCWNLPQP